MKVPSSQEFVTIPAGGVITTDLVVYSMKVDATTYVNLITGALSTGTLPTAMFTYFPDATLVLGT